MKMFVYVVGHAMKYAPHPQSPLLTDVTQQYQQIFVWAVENAAGYVRQDVYQ